MSRPRIEDVEVPVSASDGDVPTVDTGVLVYAAPAGGAPSGSAGGVLSGTYPNPGFAADMATQGELDAHVNDTSDAHDASAISFSPTGTIAATDVQAAIAEVAAEAAGGSAHVIEDEGTPLTQRTNMSFEGGGVTAADVAGKTVVTIPGGSGLSVVKAVRTAGNVSVGASEVSIDTGLDLTIAAATGDLIGLNINAMVDPQASQYMTLNMATIVSGSIVHYCHDGGVLMDDGNPGWIVGGSGTNGYTGVSGEMLYEVQSGDISGGNVTFRLRSVNTTSSPTRTVRANALDPLRVWAKNYG